MEGAFFVAPDAVCTGLLRGECCMHGDRGGVSGAYGVLSYGVKEPRAKIGLARLLVQCACERQFRLERP